ncbi:MAG TPA: recombinase family protein [Candidatus Udaeobacter sp.]
MESTNSRIPVAILVRVSTNRQETDRQISDLTQYAVQKGYNVVEICQETVSGRADENEREGLSRAKELAISGAVKKVLVHEISRLARKSSIVHRFVETLEECGVSLYWHQQGFETLLENGKRNPSASIMLAILAETARSEIETLVERIKSGLAEARRKGKLLGRPKGSCMQSTAFLERHRDVVRHLRAGQSIRNCAKITGKGNSTVQRVKVALAS